MRNGTTLREHRSPRRKHESIRDAAVRNATDAIYAARDADMNMHDAGEAAADAVLMLVYAEAKKAAGRTYDPSNPDQAGDRYANQPPGDE